MPALRPFRLGWRRGGGFGGRDEGGECRGVFDGDVREDFAVERDAGDFQSVDQLAVGQAVVPSGRSEALNPKLAILALLDAAVALGVAIRAIGRFLRGLVELALGEKQAFCPLEMLLAPCTALGAAFYASHGVSPFLWETKRVARTRKHALRNGFVSGVVLNAALFARPQMRLPR